MSACERCQAQLLEHLYGLLEPEEARAVEDHLGGCPACQAAQERARQQQRVLAAAARAEVPPFRFEPPADDAPATLPLPARRRAWGNAIGWATAACVCLALGALGIAGAALYSQGHDLQGKVDQAQQRTAELAALRRNLDAQRQESLEQAEREVVQAAAQVQEIESRRVYQLQKVEKELNDKQAYVVVGGPTNVQPGAPNEYQIEVRNRANKLVPAQIEARVVDLKATARDKQIIFETGKGQRTATGQFKVSLPRDLPVGPDSDLRLEVVAQADTGPRAQLSESLTLARPTFFTHLTTDKPMYQPGETVYFRSLTLDRFSLKPAADDMRLVFTVHGPNQEEIIPRIEGLSRLVDDKQKEVLGPDQQPIRGIGSGAFRLEDELAGGEYTLTVSEAGGRFQPQKRRFLVNRYQPHKLTKELEFTKKSYGPGDEVVVACKATTGDKPLVGKPATATVQVDGQRLDAEGRPNDSATLTQTTNATGACQFRFKLPAAIERGEASIAVQFSDGASVETMVRPIPVVLKKLLVEFFPEGGDLVAGVPNRVYFQGRTLLGKPAELHGRIVDASGKDVAEVRTFSDADHPGANQGLGRFELIPRAGVQYRLKIDTPVGMEGNHDLPAVKADGVVLSVPGGVTTSEEPIRVVLHSAGKARNLLVGTYCRGRLLDHRRVSVPADQPVEAVLQPEAGVGGVYRLTVFEERGTDARPDLVPVAERLVFRQSASRLNLKIAADKKTYSPADPVRLTLATTNEKGEAVPSILLVAVVDKNVLAMADEKTARAMPTHFLLTTEVRQPEDLEHADFLLTDHPSALRALDLLLGTQGWRRFAEQNPQDFQKKNQDEADRLFLAAAPAAATRPNAADALPYKQARVVDEFRPQLESVYARLALAEERRETLLNDDSYAADRDRLQAEAAQAAALLTTARQDWTTFQASSRQVRTRGLQALAAFLLLMGLGALLLGLLRQAENRLPYLATWGCAMVLCVMVFLAAFANQRGGPGGRTEVAMSSVAPPDETNAALAQPGRPDMAMPADDKVREAEMFLREEKAGFGGGLAGGLPVPRPQGAAAVPPPVAVAPPAPPRGEDGEGRQIQMAKALGQPLQQNQLRDANGRRAAEKRDLDRGLEQQDGLARKMPDRLRNGLLVPEEPFPRGARPAGPAFKAGEPGAPAMDAMIAIRQRELPPPALVVREYRHERIPDADPSLRSDFTETLLWQPVVVLPGGEVQLPFQLGDAVTSYQVTAYGHTLDGRVGAASLTFVSKLPFAVDPKIPLEVTATDLVDLPVAVVNDSDATRPVRLQLETTGLTLETGTADDRLTLAPGERVRRVFRVRPSLLAGDARVLVRGLSEPFAADSIVRTIRVVPDGFPIVGSHSDLLEGSAVTEVDLPASMIKGTLKVQANVYLSTLADLQSGLEALLREPCGCFEQTSTSNYPNLLILDYLKETDQAKPEIARRARDLLDRGYQRLTSYECPSTPKKMREGFEWFGSPDYAHEALTAYGLLQFRDMARVYDVDPMLVERTRGFLMSRKDGKGGFLRNPQALDSFGRAPADITNAYIVWALTESGPEDDVARELDVLAGQARDAKDPYFLALVANSLLNRGRADEGVEMLKKLAAAQNKEGCLEGAQTSITASGGRDLHIETTALGLLAWLKSHRPEFTLNVQAANRWLQQQRGGYGGFGSTQSTILALKALIAFAKDNKKTPEAGVLTISRDGQVLARQEFPAGAAEAITLDLPNAEEHLQPGKNELRVAITGKNVFPYTLVWTYQTVQPASADNAPVRLAARLDRAEAVEGEAVRLTATVANTTDKGHGMTVAIIGLPAGLTLPEDMKQLKDMARLRDNNTRPGLISAFETRGRELILYWRDLAPSAKIEVNLDLICRVPGQYRGPASRAYLYYNADHKHWVEPLAVGIQPKVD